jgi:hypothetical protein
VSLAIGAATLVVNSRTYPLGWSVAKDSYHPDMFFFEALSTSLARFGPSESIFMAGAEIRYHWLAYAWSGQIAESAGTEPFFMLTRILPVIALVGCVAIAVALTQKFTKSAWAPTLAGVLIVFGGYVGATYGTVLNFDSPSQQLATLWLLGLSASLLAITRNAPLLADSRVQLILLTLVIGILAAASTGGKGSAGAVALGAWAVTTLIALLRKEMWSLRALLAFAAAGTGTVFVYFAYISGSAGGGGLGIGSLLDKASSVQGLNPFEGQWGIVFGTLILILATAPRWAGIVWLVSQPKSRWQPISTYSIGLILTSVVSLALISGGLNDTWFTLAAAAPLSVTSAIGIGRAVKPARPGFRLPATAIGAVIGGLLLTGVVALLWSFGPASELTLRWTAPLVAFGGAVLIAWAIRNRSSRSGPSFLALALTLLVVMGASGRILSLAASDFGVQPETGLNATEFSPSVVFVESIDKEPRADVGPLSLEAARWVRENTAPDSLIATNTTLGFVVPALTGRQTYLSGVAYQAPYGRPESLMEIPLRDELSHEFIGSPSRSSALALCEAGVDVVWVDQIRDPDTDLSEFATSAFRNDAVEIVFLDGKICNRP